MSGCCSGNSLFGEEEGGFIKINGGSFVAIEGSNTVAKLDVSSFRTPYKLISMGRVTLKASQTNYLLSNFGLGDNSNFIAIKATYKSKFEEDNYLNWTFFDDSRINVMQNLMVLTSNSTNRTPQIYISNPNPNHPVSLEILVSTYDDDSEYFTDSVTYYSSLIYDDITSDNGVLSISDLRNINVLDIETVYISEGKINIKIDSEIIQLGFTLNSDMMQVFSSIIFLTKNPSIVLPIAFDVTPPTINFHPIVGATFVDEFDISISIYDITKSNIASFIIDNISDLRDGILPISPLGVSIYTQDTTDPSNIITTYYDVVETIGTYFLELRKSDNAGNVTIVNLIMNVIP